MKIAILGAGNIGTAMAALLSQTPSELTLIARGNRKKEIEQYGIKLDERGTLIKAKIDIQEQLTEPVDAIFICVKSHDLPLALSNNLAGVDDKTLIIPMINGLPFWFNYDHKPIEPMPFTDNEGLLDGQLWPENIIGAVLLMTVHMQINGLAVSSNTPTLSLAPVTEKNSLLENDDMRLARLSALLTRSGVSVEISVNIRQKILTKLLANLATNPLSALTGKTLSEIGHDEQLRNIAFALADEFRACTTKLGYKLPDNAWLGDILIDAGDFATSMLQDARSGKKLELDAICRAPIELARHQDVSMKLLCSLTKMVSNSTSLPCSDSECAELLATLLSDWQSQRIDQ